MSTMCKQYNIDYCTEIIIYCKLYFSLHEENNTYNYSIWYCVFCRTCKLSVSWNYILSFTFALWGN